MARSGSERGAAAVEFAILLPVLIVIIFGITAFGLALSRLETYVSAAREGARYVAVRCAPDSTTGCTGDLVVAKVETAAVGYPIGPGTPAADILCDASTVGQPVTVGWLQHIPIQIPLLPDLSRDLTIQGVFRCE